ncbi:DMT family transporter [Oceanobacter sp. 3_MG-2023]|uniref:DMT family transporter n=1 Tax=Oceanobacter sp. 3_MG-2023 TaxID=3062622 RepID=UPI0027331D39|nr:EamA family transporter [Oceanobacter sp. 3_MG-2023]MDP2506845.1 EamA family transporter [Oceanobacter sp. 3_MG-2023]
MLKYGLIALIAPLLWGTTYSVTQHWLSEVDPIWLSALRTLLPGVMLLPFIRIAPLLLRWRQVVVLGTFNIALFTVLLFKAIQMLPGGVAATLVSTVPLQILLIRWLQGRAPALRQLLAAVGGVAGVALLVWQAPEPLNWLGVMYALLAGLSMSIGILLIPVLGAGIAPLAMATGQFLFSGVSLTVLAFMTAAPLPEITLPAVLAMGWIGPLGMGVGYFCWFRAMGHIPVERLSFLGLLNPLVAVLCGLMLMGETMTPTQLLGMVVVLACVVAAQWPVKKAVMAPV